MIYRCTFTTRYKRPAKVILTNIVIDIEAASEDDARTKLMELWPRRPGSLPAKHRLRITPTDELIYRHFQKFD